METVQYSPVRAWAALVLLAVLAAACAIPAQQATPTPSPSSPKSVEEAHSTRTQTNEAVPTVRREAGIEDVRLHTLRHTVASHAVMNGVPVPVVSRLLGHTNAQMTLRYAHLADRDIAAAAERIGAEMARVMALGFPPCLGVGGGNGWLDVPTSSSSFAAISNGEAFTAAISNQL